METHNANWLPLTEYALKSGMSISTLRRKIKANSIRFKLEDGRYLISCDELPTGQRIVSSDSVGGKAAVLHAGASLLLAEDELAKIHDELRQHKGEEGLRWRALEARVAGLARKLESFTEQVAELKMLVKIFEEKLDRRD